MLKKLILLLMVLSLPLGMHAMAESTSEDVLEQLSGCTFTLSSGVGAWSTDVWMAEDGRFTGEFHDSDMGDTGDGYPNGTIYLSSFHGQFVLGEKLNETTYQLLIPQLIVEAMPESIVDGVRYLPMDAYGLSGAEELLLYLPGTPIDTLPEGFMMWARMPLMGYADTDTLPFYGLYHVKDELGLIAEKDADQLIIGGADGPTSIWLGGVIEQYTFDWVLPQQFGMDDIAQQVWNNADLDAAYTPVLLLGTRDLGEAVRYCYLCTKEQNLYMVYVNQYMNGDCLIDEAHPLIL